MYKDPALDLGKKIILGYPWPRLIQSRVPGGKGGGRAGSFKLELPSDIWLNRIL